MLWRRFYDVPPPIIEAGSEFSQDADPRYAGEPIPATECLKDVLARLLPYWEGTIVPDITEDQTDHQGERGKMIGDRDEIFKNGVDLRTCQKFPRGMLHSERQKAGRKRAPRRISYLTCPPKSWDYWFWSCSPV